MLPAGEQEMILARVRGDSLKEIGDRHGVSYQRVQLAVRSGQRAIDDLELALLRNRGTDELMEYAIPYGPNYNLHLQFVEWCLSELRKRGVQLKVHKRTAKNGIAFFIEGDYSRSNG